MPSPRSTPPVSIPAAEPPRGNYHHGDLRHAVLEAAVTILAELGPEGFTLREAARRIGVSHRAVYRHFEDKLAVLSVVAEEGYRALATDMREAIERSGAVEPADRLIALAEGYVRFARRERARYQVMFGPRLNADERFPALETAIREAVRVVSHELKLAAPGASSLVRRDAGITLWSSVHGFAALQLTGRVPLSDRHIARYVDTVMRPVTLGVIAALQAR